MASGHDSTTVDEQGAHEHPGEGEPVGGFEGPFDDEHAQSDHEDDDHGHGHGHGHDDHHASGGDAWVLIPIAIGLVIGLILALYFGLGSGASAL